MDLVLDAIAAPAIVVDIGGTVLHANSNARTLIARDSRGIALSLARAMAGTPADLAWDLTPLRGGRVVTAFSRSCAAGLASLRSPGHSPRRFGAGS